MLQSALAAGCSAQTLTRDSIKKVLFQATHHFCATTVSYSTYDPVNYGTEADNLCRELHSLCVPSKSNNINFNWVYWTQYTPTPTTAVFPSCSLTTPTTSARLAMHSLLCTTCYAQLAVHNLQSDHQTQSQHVPSTRISTCAVKHNLKPRA